RFQKSVERLFSEHVDFIDDVDLIFAGGGGVTNCFIDLAYIIDPAVRGAIDLNDIKRVAKSNVPAGSASVARIECGRRILAIDRFCKQSCKRCFPCSSWA